MQFRSALVISTPAAIDAGLSAGARRGRLMKGSTVRESLGRITAVAFDKTETLTAGKPVVTDIIAGSRTESQVLSLAAALEKGSSHPLAVAIRDRAKTEKVPTPPSFDANAVPSEGLEGGVGGEQVFLGSPQAVAKRARLSVDQQNAISALNAQGKTVSVVVVGGLVAGFIAMRDKAQPEAVAGLAASALLASEPSC